MLRSTFFALFLLLPFAAQAQPALTFARGGTVEIKGTSNVHGWTCKVEQYTGTVAGGLTGEMPAAVTEATFTVPVAGIDCDNGTMNGKMRDALKAGQHASIRYTLTEARATPGENGRFTLATKGRLTIAGQTQPVQMTVQGEVMSDGRYHFTGSTPVKMSQYGIKAPTAMLGAMRTGDEVTIVFDLVAGR